MIQNDNSFNEEIEKAFSDEYEGYVLITCGKPKGNGKMEINMTYGGSAILAQMLVDGAQKALSVNVEEEIDEFCES